MAAYTSESAAVEERKASFINCNCRRALTFATKPAHHIVRSQKKKKKN